MNALVIYAHPNPMSFNAAVAKVVEEELKAKGAAVKVKDLYAMKWNPILSGEDFQGLHTGNIPADIKQEQADVTWADVVVMVAFNGTKCFWREPDFINSISLLAAPVAVNICSKDLTGCTGLSGIPLSAAGDLSTAAAL